MPLNDLRSLGRDFWIYRSGQVISQVGVSCRSTALSWWVLDKTGSALQMAAVLTPAMMAQLVLLPLLGPLADRLPRKRLMAISDAWRGLMTLLLTAMVGLDLFNLYALIALQILSAAGAALAETSTRSIVPQIVSRQQLPTAIRLTEIIGASAVIVGGLLGGLVISASSIKVAFLLDGLTFLVAAGCSLAIKAATVPIDRPANMSPTFQGWMKELLQGLKFLVANRGLLGIAYLAMLLNLFMAPLSVAVPVLVKQTRQMPPWFLGGLNSGFGVGTVLGTLVVIALRRRLRTDRMMAAGICLLGLGIAALPFVPTLCLPAIMIGCLGIGGTMANLPMATQMSLMVPDSYRARIDSTFLFLCGLSMPLGTAVSGWCVEKIGVNTTLLVVGCLVAVVAPVFAFIPAITEFMRGHPEPSARPIREVDFGLVHQQS